MVERLTAEQLAPLARSIDTKTRMDLLSQALGPGKLFLLVELRVSLAFSDLDGAYKWSVESHLSVSSTDSLATANSADFGTSVFLHQEFEREREVLRQASEDLADRVGILLDSHFAGRAGTEGGAPPPPAPPPEPPEAPPAATPSAPSARGEWESQPLYFVLLDRFAPDEGTAKDVNRADPDDWHGGSIATLRRHLDDLKALGVGSVWLSPVSSCREEKLGRLRAVALLLGAGPREHRATLRNAGGAAGAARRAARTQHAAGARHRAQPRVARFAPAAAAPRLDPPASSRCATSTTPSSSRRAGWAACRTWHRRSPRSPTTSSRRRGA